MLVLYLLAAIFSSSASMGGSASSLSCKSLLFHGLLSTSILAYQLASCLSILETSSIICAPLHGRGLVSLCHIFAPLSAVSRSFSTHASSFCDNQTHVPFCQQRPSCIAHPSLLANFSQLLTVLPSQTLPLQPNRTHLARNWYRFIIFLKKLRLIITSF